MYTSGSIRRLGRVDHRNTALDTHRIERERGITVFSKQAQLRTENLELCLLDTPGHADLTAETERTLGVIDYALLVISGTDGVQAHTETLWRLLEKYGVPVIIFATKMDLTGSNRENILPDLRAACRRTALMFPTRARITPRASLCAMSSFWRNTPPARG